jgi:hypothetical protein
VSLDDKLPHVICTDCLKLLKTSCELRKLIRSSDIVLRELLEDVDKSETTVVGKEFLKISLKAEQKPTAASLSMHT